MTCIERDVDGSKLKVTITASLGIEFDVIPSTGESAGRVFRSSCENKELCAYPHGHLSDPNILEAMLRHVPVTLKYNHKTVNVTYASSFYGVDTSRSLIAFRLRKEKPRDISGLGLAKAEK